jgi:guanylate kinase
MSTTENSPARKPVVVILHGPSGVGKDAVIDKLRTRTGIHRVMSSTDRAPRDGEKDGVHYHFLSTPEFKRKIENGEFAEYAHVYKQWKGVERCEVEPFLERGEDIIIRTDVNGAATWRERMEGAVSVILLADEDTLRERRARRDGEDHESHAIRNAEMARDIADAPNNDYQVYNNNDALDAAVDELQAIIERERENPDRPWPRLRPAPETIRSPAVGEAAPR